MHSHGERGIYMNTVRMGIIGIGAMGSNHFMRITAGEIAGMTLTAVADINPERLAWAREQCPGIACFSDAAELMESGLVDAVLIATPHYYHPVYAIEALKRDIHVLTEKPAGVYTGALRAVNEAAAKSKAAYAIMFNQRTNCIYRKMKQIVDSGEMGRIRRINWIITDWYRPQGYYDSGAWRATWSGEGGGVLMNQAPHNLDLWQWICGMPQRVTALCGVARWHDIEVEDDVTAVMEYPNGVTGVLVTSTGDCPGTNRLEISLDGGKLVAENGELIAYRTEMFEQDFSKSRYQSHGGPAVERFTVETDGLNPQHREVLRAFAAHILRGEPLVADGREGLNALMLANAMYLSAWTKRPVELPVDEELYLSELNKRRAASGYRADACGIARKTEIWQDSFVK